MGVEMDAELYMQIVSRLKFDAKTKTFLKNIQ